MNNSSLNLGQDPRRQLQQQQETQPAMQVLQSNRNTTQNPAPSAAGFLRSQQPAANQMNLGMPANPLPFSALLPTGDATQFQFGANLGNDLNRLQQLQHLGIQPTAVLPQQPNQLQPGQQQPHQQPNELLRSYMDQKLQLSRYEDQLRQRLMAAPAEPLLQPPILDEARFLMGQTNPLAASLTTLNRPPLTLPSPHELSLRDDTRRMRGGVIEPFPEKLHRLLTEVEAAGRADVISFIANGKAFAIHKPDKFFKEVVPKYFRQSRLSSFKRQLNLYGFELINTGPARGGYFHEMFIKDRPELCRRMRRVAVKLHAKQNDKQKSPDFYKMPPVTAKEEGEEEGGVGEVKDQTESEQEGERSLKEADEN